MGRTAQVKSFTLTPENNAKLARQYELATQLAAIKAEEFALRQELSNLIGTPTKLDGTENFELPGGWVLCLRKIQNITATNKGGETVALLEAVAAIDESIPVRLVQWVPDISTKVYKEELMPLLDKHPALKPLAAAAIQVKPGAPVLEFKPPTIAIENVPMP